MSPHQYFDWLFIDYIVVGLLGLVLGSFTTALAYRVPRNIPWAFGGKKSADSTISACRSVCVSCNAPLRIIDLVPVFSWMFLRGSCRHCSANIGVSYLLIELGVVFACILAYMAMGFSVETFFIILSIPFLAALLVIDLEFMILPNQLVWILGVIGISRLFVKFQYSADSLYYFAASAVYALFSWFLGWSMSKILKKDALGFGDVKFFAVAGLWLGLSLLSWFCLLSGVLGVVFALLWRSIKQEQVFPFGPALIAAFYILLLADGSILF